MDTPPRPHEGPIPGPAEVPADGSPPVVPDAIEMFERAVASAGAKRREEIPGLVERDRARSGQVMHKIDDLWATAFSALEALIVEGDDFLRTLWKLARSEPGAWSAKTHVLTSLVRRCLYTSRGILVLLRAGLSLEAHARWRSLHEFAATAQFIAMHDEDLAERYYAHRTVEARKAQRELARDRYDPVIGAPELDAASLESLERAYQEVVDAYGNEITKDWGWTAAVLPSGKRHFGGVREAVAATNPMKNAHVAVHASAGTVFWNHDPDAALWPPTDGGIAAPGANATRELARVFYAYAERFVTVPSMVELAMIRSTVFKDLCDDVWQCFFDAAEHEASTMMRSG